MERRLSNHTMQVLQERVLRDIPERFHYPRILSVLALNEEIGELLYELSPPEGQPQQPAAIASEVGDVFLSCIEIANVYGFTLQPQAALPDTADRQSIALGLCIAAAEVSKECLEIEGFEQSRHEHLSVALNRVVESLAALALSLDIDLTAAFEKKFEKILNRIADGTWDRLYGNVLVNKRRKLD
jgi:NTP pyrophosphatase (non-canonical NTP hydrolase)